MAKIGASECRRFAEAFLRTMDPEQAAAAIGASGGTRLLALPDVEAEIGRQRAAYSRQLCPEDVIRRMAELAFGRANDCVSLVLEDGPDLSRLDLSLLSEVKRSDKGGVEVRLIDRVAVLEKLMGLTGNTDESAEAFFRAMEDGEDA